MHPLYYEFSEEEEAYASSEFAFDDNSKTNKLNVVSRPVQHYHDLGRISSSLTDSNEPFCMLNRQREVTLPRFTVAPTATSSAYF